MIVDLDKLENIISLLLLKLKEKKGSFIELEKDFYWDICTKELYNPYTTPQEMSLGQISDDITEVQRLLECKEDAIPYDLKRIAEILKILSI